MEIVRDPYGRTIPGAARSPASYRDELRWRKAMQSAQESGDAQAELNARRMLNSVMEAAQPPRPELPTPQERIGAGAARIAGGVNQLVPSMLGGFSPEQEAQFAAGRELYKQGLPPGMDWWGLGGEMAVGAPLGLLPQVRAAGPIGRTLAGAVTGGAEGGLLFAETPRERVGNIVGGATLGGAGALALPPIVNAAAATVEGGRRAANLLDPRLYSQARTAAEGAAQSQGVDLASLGETGRAALQRDTRRALSTGADLSPEALVRRERMRRFGYEGPSGPTEGQLTLDPWQRGDESDLSKLTGVGEDLKGRFEAQQQQDLLNVEQFQEQYGGPAEPGAAGTAAREAAQKRARDWQTRVSQQYEIAREARPDARIPGPRLKEATKEILAEVDVPGAVKTRIGTLSKRKKKGITPQELEKLDKLLTANQGINPATDRAMRNLKTAVRGLISEAGEEFGAEYASAVQQAAKRFEAIGELGTITNQLVSGRIDPIKVVPRLKGAGLEELTALRNFVADAAPEQWQKVRAGVMADLMDRAMPSGTFQQASYNKAVRGVGRERLAILFGDEAARDLMDFGAVVRDLYGPVRGFRGSRSNTPIAQFNLMGNMMSGILRSTPLVATAMRAVVDPLESAVKRRAVRAALNPTPTAPLINPNPMEGPRLAGRAFAPLVGLVPTAHIPERNQ